MKVDDKRRQTTWYKKYEFQTKETVKCKCGHSIFLPESEPVKICSFCNRIVFKNSKEEFKFRMAKKSKGIRKG